MINEFTLERLDIPGGWIRGEGDWAGVAAAMKRGETVEVIPTRRTFIVLGW